MADDLNGAGVGKPEPAAALPDEKPLKISPDMLAREPKDVRLEFEEGMSYAPRLTLTLIACYALVFAWELSTGALVSEKSIIDAGALYRKSVLAGEWWRLATATFLHGGLEHLIGNCLFFYILGMTCEHAYTTKRVSVIYLVSGLSGSVASMLAHPGPSVGASGVVFGVMGAVIVFFVKYRHDYRQRDNRIVVVLGVWTVYSLVTGFMTPYVDNFAHLGGMAGGMLTAMALPRDNPLK